MTATRYVCAYVSIMHVVHRQLVVRIALEIERCFSSAYEYAYTVITTVPWV